MTLRRILLLSTLFGLTLLGACGRDDNTGAENVSTVAESVDFLVFPNPQASLGAADYDIVITNNTVTAFTYTLTVTQTDGSVQTFTGSVASGATSPPISFSQNHAGGVTIVLNSGGANATLQLRNGGTTSVVASATAGNPSISLPRFQIDQAAYANAYYAVTDPTSIKTTLSGFKTANGFGAGACTPTNTVTVEEYEVKFRDVHDLGYGRHMCVHRNITTSDIAAWVENFQVTAIPGQQYGPLNLEALIEDDRRWHVGTNAIEYSATPTSGGVKITKFYTFNPDGSRRTFVDLDGRGAKAMPIPCISCHGGKGLPLTAAGAFPIIAAFPRADTLAHMQGIDVSTLDFSNQSPWTRAQQEASLKAINKIVLCSYPLPGAVAGAEDNCRTATVGAAQWQGTTAEMIKSWYGGNNMPNPTAVDNYVPAGWIDNGGTIPNGSTNFYQTVVAPNCRVCHAQRGNGNFLADDVDFTEYQKFIGTNTHEGFAVGPAGGGHYNRINYHVFEKGNMPLALLKWEQFWASSAPSLLASLVPGASSGGTALKPNRPIAIPGPDRMRLLTGSPVQLSGADSVNAISHRWRITSGNAANATLANSNSIRPTFTAIVAGTYTVELVVGDGKTDSAPVTQTLVAAANPNPNSIRWADIKNILQNTGGISPATTCTGCHFSGSGNSGPPVFYDTYDRVGSGNANDAANLHQFYLDIRARVNFTDVEASFILRRPSGHHHPGGLLNGFDVDNQIGGDRTHYDTILNWIMNGAPE